MYVVPGLEKMMRAYKENPSFSDMKNEEETAIVLEEVCIIQNICTHIKGNVSLFRRDLSPILSLFLHISLRCFFANLQK